MWMTSYIREIQRQLVAVYGFKENPAQPGIPLDVPDGEYPMTIEGKLDRVRIEDGKISCCNFDESAPTAAAAAESDTKGVVTSVGDGSFLVSTITLRTVIEQSAASQEFRSAFIGWLTERGVFDDNTIPSIRLGMLIAEYAHHCISVDDDLNAVFSDIGNLDKLPFVKLFHLGELITLAGGRTLAEAPFVASEGQDGLRAIISYMTNAGMMTETAVHTLRHVCCKGLLEQHPWLAEIDVSVVTTKNHESWLADQVAKYGERHPVAPLVNTEDPTVSVSDLHRRDAKRMNLGRMSPLLKTMPITRSDVGKYFVVSVDGQSARIMTGGEFARIGVDEFDSWIDIGEFDINQW